MAPFRPFVPPQLRVFSQPFDFCRPFAFILLRIAFPATPFFSQPSALPGGVTLRRAPCRLGHLCIFTPPVPKSFSCHRSKRALVQVLCLPHIRKTGGAVVVNFAAAVRTAASTNRNWNTDTTTHPRFRSTSGITCADNAVLTRLRAMWVMEPWSLR